MDTVFTNISGTCQEVDLNQVPEGQAAYGTVEECQAALNRWSCDTENLACVRQEATGEFDTPQACAEACFSFNIYNGVCNKAGVDQGAYRTAEACNQVVNPTLRATTLDSQCHSGDGGCGADAGYDPSSCVKYLGTCYSKTARACKSHADCSLSWLGECTNNAGGGDLYCRHSGITDCECYSQKYVGSAWPSTLPNNEVVFPEQCLAPIKLGPQNSGRVGLAFSGGGARAFSAGLGYARGLANLMTASGKSYLESAAYASTVSGGSWFYGTFSFARRMYSADKLLGKSLRPGDATLGALQSENKYQEYLGTRLVDSPLYYWMSKAEGSDTRVDDMWSYAIGKIFLDPYGLDANVPLALDAEHAQLIMQRNPELGYAIVPYDDGPFWISGAALLYEPLFSQNLFPSINMTPLYSGVSALLQAPNGVVLGGVWLDTFCTGTSAPDPAVVSVPLHSDGGCIPISVPLQAVQNRVTTLRDVLGTSSSAYASDMYDLPLLNELIPAFDVWSAAQPGVTTEVRYGDGGIADNSGVLALLARGVPKIVAFSNVKNAMDTCIPADIRSLFGVQHGCRAEYRSNDTPQVFDDKQFDHLFRKLQAAKSTGGPTFARMQLPVLRNDLYGVKGGYVVDILFVVLQRSTKFEALLPQETRQELGIDGKFINFPYFPTMNANGIWHDIFYLSLEQVNLMSSYTEWCLQQPELQAHIQNMYEPDSYPMYFDDNGGAECVPSAQGFVVEKECLDSLTYSFAWNGVDCARFENTNGESRAECLDAHRPAVQGQYPNMSCSSSAFQPTVNRRLDSADPTYYMCLTPEEMAAAPARQYANAGYAPPSERGKMRQACDSDQNCPSGSWCCADAANTSGASHSGRCVYCNNNDSFCWAAGSESASNTCATNSMQWWNDRF
jgi:hypothetical protein